MRDRRNFNYIIKISILFAIMFLWFSTFGIVFAQNAEESENRLLIEIIAGLLVLLQTLVGYIYVSGINDLKKSIRHLYMSKMDIAVHKALCPVDKTKETEVEE